MFLIASQAADAPSAGLVLRYADEDDDQVRCGMCVTNGRVVETLSVSEE